MNKDWLPTGSHWGLTISHRTVVTGPMVPSGHKFVWHTTEGASFDGADSTLRGNGDEPHFLIDMHTGKVIQYVALSQYSKSLRHPGGTPETNRAGCIQVEILGFASESPNWTDAQMRKLAALAVLVEHRVSIPRMHPYIFAPGHRATPQGFITAKGHLGHEHVPNNDHVDPGKMRIHTLFNLMAEVEKAHA